MSSEVGVMSNEADVMSNAADVMSSEVETSVKDRRIQLWQKTSLKI